MVTGQLFRDKWALEAAARKLCNCGHKVGEHREWGSTSRIVGTEIVWEDHPRHRPGLFHCTHEGCDCERGF